MIRFQPCLLGSTIQCSQYLLLCLKSESCTYYNDCNYLLSLKPPKFDTFRIKLCVKKVNF